jgi:histidinol-phosphate aminotransferase
MTINRNAADAPIPRPGILSIEPYVGGQSKIQGKSSVIKLSSNEGAFGPNIKAIEACQKIEQSLHRYPDGHHLNLRQSLADHYHINFQNIVCGNGSDDVLQLLARGYSGPGDEVLYSQHGFLVYPIAALASGATPVPVPESNLSTSIDSFIASITPKTKMVFIANPNNPTGTYISFSEVKRLHAALPSHILLILDEAYIEYVDADDYGSALSLVDEFHNVVVTRTFSKIFGLGGLRLGWAYCPPAVADVLNRTRGPFNVSSLALVAGEATLLDQDFIKKSQSHNREWREWLKQELQNLGYPVIPSQTNFLLIRLPSIKEVKSVDAHLRNQGIIVRQVSAYGLPDYLRITIGLDHEMKSVVKSLKEYKINASNF